MMTKRAVGLVILLALVPTAYAGLSSTLNFAISAPAGPNGSTNPGGALFTLIPLSDTFTVQVGQSQQISGIGLYNISNIVQSRVNDLVIMITLTDPQDMGSVLNNPNAYINVTLYYPNSGGPVTYQGVTYSNAGSTGIITKKMTTITLSTNQAPSAAYYLVLASITVPSGKNPPGQQSQIDTLHFYVDVRA